MDGSTAFSLYSPHRVELLRPARVVARRVGRAPLDAAVAVCRVHVLLVALALVHHAARALAGGARGDVAAHAVAPVHAVLTRA
jgi:hypothetical protein